MAKILLIDDDPALLDALALTFEGQGHDVLTASDGQAGLETLARESVDAIVSDVNMPRLDGFTLCRRLREAGSGVPLILLTARDSEIDEALGLELGADDYVAKPFSPRVLQARLAALLRRDALRRAPEPTERRTIGRLELDTERLEARYDGTPFVTTVTEFRLLSALTARPGFVRSREQLMADARADDSVVEARIIDTYVRRLRRKIEAIAPEFDAIETVIGAGYRWKRG